MSTSGKLISVAIDFGTTFSGYAYSTKGDFKQDPAKVFAANWSDGQGLITTKAPTAVLFRPDGSLSKFGYDAETEYASLVGDNAQEGWSYFRRFKMLLFHKKVTTTTTFRDENGSSMNALKVVSAVIRYFKDKFLDDIQNKIKAITLDDINWVLTVPAIWDDNAKEFMAMAAEEAGIPENRLILVYEPEAAALFCKHTPFSKEALTGKEESIFSEGSKFMIIDLGGGTIDITSHEVNCDGRLDALVEPSGGPWGGVLVDAKWYNLLEELFGSDVVNEFCEDFTDKLDLDRVIEVKKRVIRPSETEFTRVKFPTLLFEIFAEKNGNMSFQQKLNNSKFENKVKYKRGSLEILNKLLQETFCDSVSNMTAHVQRELSREELKDIKTLILVGGFSESELVRNSIKASFPGYTLLMPQEASASVLKGAVIFGHCKDFIKSHKLPYSYGVSTTVPFDVNIHKEVFKTVMKNGSLMCNDIFHPLVRKGEKIVVEETTREELFRSPKPGMLHVEVDIYKIPQDVTPGSVLYTIDCKRVCTLNLAVENIQCDEKATVIVQMQFGGTRIEFSAKEFGTDNSVSCKPRWFP
ncbi:heat shock 70 kDa protein 12A-like [Mya arenaria]|uniref:heat shock 70 kDa protein 12A-like n=1 Tax=Mya arenaria TaxID=6604 RepID=UPI0022E54123|nr:heat shock 70 kDa protein 12A-like [Mya arenaria]